ncbi:hypothetical protein Ocin01_18815 [Orchesella cincta]|uniref:DUF7789 domain-containing protein n=1 Tax=Orchesella cincta TaxID=48709 RepID=A0A1D2M4G9_ORCCI|nr:hypothetical protein Ocin01_18815 [Orchesella cincta]
MEHSFDYSQEYDDSFAIVSSTSNIGAASGSGARSTDPDLQPVHYRRQSIVDTYMRFLPIVAHSASKVMMNEMRMMTSEKSCKDFRVHEWIHLVISLLNNCAYLTLAGYLMYKYMSDSDHYVISTVIIVKFAVAWKYFALEQAIFKTVGTDMNRVSIFRSLFFGFSLMVFDMEISLSALLLFLRNGFSNIVVHEIAILSAGSVFIIMWIYLGYTAVRTESHALTYTFYCVSILQPVYILLSLYRNLKWSGSSEPTLVVSSHVISVIALVGPFWGDSCDRNCSSFLWSWIWKCFGMEFTFSVKNSAEYEELRRILFHPINPVQSYYNPHSSSRAF